MQTLWKLESQDEFNAKISGATTLSLRLPSQVDWKFTHEHSAPKFVRVACIIIFPHPSNRFSLVNIYI
jgi:hypothetical protein